MISKFLSPLFSSLITSIMISNKFPRSILLLPRVLRSLIPPLLSIPPFKNKIALFVQSHPASSTFSNPNSYSKAIPGARVRLVKGAVIVFAFSRSQRRETNFLLQTTFRERLAVCMPREGIYCRAMMPQQRFFPRRSGAEDRLAGKK